MAFSQVITTLLFALAIARISPSACQTVEGKVSCTDCADNYDFSGLYPLSTLNHLIILLPSKFAHFTL